MANSTSDPVLETNVIDDNSEDWRKACLLDRNEFAFKNNLLSDVCFIVGEGKRKIPANKIILSLGSPVFAAMLSERWLSPASEIEVPDIEPEAFYELLRFIYCEKVKFHSSSPDAHSILYAAKKYDVEALKNKCVEFLSSTLSNSNVCFRLMKARYLQESELIDLCCKTLSKTASTAISRYYTTTSTTSHEESFHAVDIETICFILEMDQLNIEEVDLYKAILSWADFECERQNLEGNKENIKLVLKQALPLIRFRLMSPQEFSEVVSGTGILSIEEELSIFKYLSSKPRPANLRPTPRFKKSIIIAACDEVTGKIFICKQDLRRVFQNCRVKYFKMQTLIIVLPLVNSFFCIMKIFY
ncbi:unnamed protein product [Bemisia tabaci]|uniref:BTB domain-containing protein n=1 Tax=Bemisia tabaci TaxID=7038 RepID=A0A9P0F9I9_BEMTA|nr:unnamed protein product [Bemisia tabaci]